MKIRVAFVCWGNICRSTLSESVFTYKVKEKGLSDQFVIDSFATSTEEIGNPPEMESRRMVLRLCGETAEARRR